MKAVIIVTVILSALPVTAVRAQEPVPLNTWITLTSAPDKSRLEAYKYDSERYYALAPVLLEKGGRYTMFAEWDDGQAMLVLVRGFGPEGKTPNPPSGTIFQAVIYRQGGKAWRINFSVDPQSPGRTAWIVFPAYKPNRKVRVMIKSPADPDKTTEAVIKGTYIGAVVKTPLHLFQP
jgi:hypothetical protein